MKVLPIIQARVGSTRLPGKVMYPLEGQPALERVVDRVANAKIASEVVIATSTNPSDDVIKQYAASFEADVVRGSESNVLNRFRTVVKKYSPDVVVRITGDCPLLIPEFIDTGIDWLKSEDVDYVSAGLERTFPRGTTCELFTCRSFRRVIEESTEPRHREHVTPYYRENPDQFGLYNLESSQLFEEEWLQNRTDLRLTLDEPADYQLLEKVYREAPFQEILDIRDAISYVDQHDLAGINEHVRQKQVGGSS